MNTRAFFVAAAALASACLIGSPALAQGAGAQGAGGQALSSANPGSVEKGGTQTLFYASKNAGIDVVAVILVCTPRVNDGPIELVVDGAPSARASVRPGECAAVSGLEVLVRNPDPERVQNFTFQILTTYTGF